LEGGSDISSRLLPMFLLVRLLLLHVLHCSRYGVESQQVVKRKRLELRPLEGEGYSRAGL
jgi:hypothetical protein